VLPHRQQQLAEQQSIHDGGGGGGGDDDDDDGGSAMVNTSPHTISSSKLDAMLIATRVEKGNWGALLLLCCWPLNLALTACLVLTSCGSH
jgi:hypothetical protein